MNSSTLRRNVLVNVLGSGWLAVVQFIVVPIYLQLLGIEGYALIGFFVTLQGALRILDLGLASTVNRELARYSVSPALAVESKDFARTFEVFYWIVAAFIAAGLWALSPAIARHWLQDGALPDGILVDAVRSMGLLAAAQWPLSLYQGALLGLERQPLLNAIRASMATITAAAGVLALIFIQRSVTVFFLSQLAVAVVHVLVMKLALWRSLPRTGAAPRIRVRLFSGVYRFALGVSGITICSLVLTQADKVVLSKALTLEQFGYYSLASVAASALAAMNAPVFNAVFPRLTVLVAQRHEVTLRPLFRLASQAVAVATVPVALVIALFASEIVTLWTREAATGYQVGPILSILIIGTAFNTLMNLPYALQLAHGWTRLAFGINFIFALLIVPALLTAVAREGALGAAAVWAVLNLTYVLVGVPATHRRLFGDTGWYWFADVMRVLVAALAVVGLWRLLYFAQPVSPLTLVVVIAAALSGTLAAAAVSTRLREWTLTYLSARMSHPA
jgi:O-antigen/teichoic acid export membrane protein